MKDKGYWKSTMDPDDRKRMSEIIQELRGYASMSEEKQKELFDELGELIETIKETWIAETDPEWNEKEYRRFSYIY